MKHLIIALVLSFTASFSMACDQAPQMLTETQEGALTPWNKNEVLSHQDNTSSGDISNSLSLANQ